jgi:ADP-heptose:LPS heptosyltransferase
MNTSQKLKAKILRLIGSKKPTDFDIKKTESVLFLRYDRIGDMVITTPVFRELKLAYPNIKISILASKENKDVLQNNPYIDEVIVNSKKNFFGDCISLFNLRSRKLDVCIELDHSVVPHAIMRLRIINPKKIISLKKDGRYGVSGDELSMYDFYTRKPNNMHFRDIWLSTLHPFKVNSVNNNYDLFPSPNQEKVARIFLRDYANQIKVGINIKGAVKGKKIEDIDLDRICKGLKGPDKSVHIIILASPKNLKSASQLVKRMSLSHVSLCYKTSKILDVAAIIKNLDIVITPDTSISHIATAFDIPVVTIHENNLDSYNLFAPKSSINKTFFSQNKTSLEGYDVPALIDYSRSLIEKLSNENSRN